MDLMAPAGSFESLHAAIRAGADSVYLGTGKLNMRARSSFNFSPADLQKAVRICRQFGKRIYLTMNVVMYDHELKDMRDTIDLAVNLGIDAIICSDMAALSYAQEKQIGVHLSTQANISNLDSVKFYSRYADVVVLARELSLTQVASLANEIDLIPVMNRSGKPMQIEMFIHGALCMSVSGKCYLSLHHHDHSANRGDCLQDCRKAFTVRERETGLELDVENEYILSPKDLCTIHFLNKILDSGVRVLKIEGRARSPEYVATVTACYNEALVKIEEGTYDRPSIDKWIEKLSAVFNRGFWDGYYLGQRLGEWSENYGSQATQRKVYAAKFIKYYPRAGTAEFLCEAAELRIDDKVLIMGPTTGLIELVIKEIHLNSGPVEKVSQGETFSIQVPRKVRQADKLYLMELVK